jgi:diguanylate cyclase (GGDEF)-like protein
LLALRGWIADFLSIVLANLLLLSAAALFLEGIRCFRGVSSRRSFMVSLVVIPVLMLLYFTFVDNNILARIVIFSIFSAVFFGLGAWELIRNAPPDLRFPYWFTGFAFAIYSLVLIGRICITVFSHPSHDLFAPNLFQTVTFLLPLLLGIAWTFGFVMLNSERLERGLKEAQAGLQRLATTDYLTGMANHRSFSEAGEREILRARRYAHPLAVLMLDLDRFKQVNDTYGHAVGDGVLVAIAATFRILLRDIDVYGRLGGEEFAILLPETDLAGGRTTAERLRSAIADTAIDEGGVTLHITVSIGVAMLSEKDRGLDAVLKRADDAMYEAKRNGRNRVMTEPLPAVAGDTLSL